MNLLHHILHITIGLQILQLFLSLTLDHFHAYSHPTSRYAIVAFSSDYELSVHLQVVLTSYMASLPSYN